MAALVSAGCEQAERGETNVLVIGEAPKIVDPAAGPLTEPQAVLLSNIGQGLVRFDASGQIVPGLAERWNVTDDGLSYIFRLQSIEWPDGRKVTAQQVARLLKRQIASRSDNPLKDTLGAIDQDRPDDRPGARNQPEGLPSPSAPTARPAGIFDRPRGTRNRAVPDQEKQQAECTEAGEDRRGPRRGIGRARGGGARRTARTSGGHGRSSTRRPTWCSAGPMRTSPLRAPRNCREMHFASTRRRDSSGWFRLGRTDRQPNLELRRLLSQAIDRQALIDALDVPGLLAAGDAHRARP